MQKNIHNVVTDVQEKVTADHFPVTGNLPDGVYGWTVVEFTAGDCLLQFEVHLEHQVSCILVQRGFTNAQRDTIMEIFTQMMFD
jgi:hypothetical protein